MCSKVVHLLPEDKLQKYQDKFLYKLVDPEYFVDSTTEVELRTNFLKPFADNHILKFIVMKRKYNPDYAKSFYCNLEITHAGLESRFKNKVVKFDYYDFHMYFGMSYNGSDMSIAKGYDYDTVYFLMSISKFVCENIDMSNLQISQVKFDIRLLLV